jgi:hypothetical protein
MWFPTPQNEKQDCNASEDWEVSRESTISRRVFPGTHAESQPLLKIGHACKCDEGMLRDLYRVMIGREDADPA